VLKPSPQPPATGAPTVPADLAPLANALEQVRQKYHQPVDDRQLLQGAVAGMVERLDAYSTYIPPGEVGAFNHRLLGSGQGLGLRVEVADGHVVVIGPLMGSPAHRAGLRAGDVIESIDGTTLAGLSIDQVYKRLDDPSQPEARLIVLRGPKQPSRLQLTVPRVDLALETVQGLYRDVSGQWVHTLQAAPGVVYIRVREFVRSTPDDLHRVLTGLGTPRGIVLDLRDNPGGMMEAAVATANFFLAKGRIVTAHDRTQQPQAFDARRENLYSSSIPLVVLVNGRTASAAEIVAGALWVHNRAAVTGERTLGKGCVQSMISLGDLGQINLTTAQYTLAGGLSITRQPGGDVWGVEPHQAVSLLHEDQVAALRIRAEVIPSPTPTTAPAVVGTMERMEEKFLRLDTQLAQALTLVQDATEMKTLLKQGTAARAKRMPTTAPSGR